MSTVVSLQTHSGNTKYGKVTQIFGCNSLAFGMKMIQENRTNRVKIIGNEIHITK